MKQICWIPVILLGIYGFADAGITKKVIQGNKLFDEGNFDEALTKYNDAQIDSPSSPEIFFNMGTVYYKQKKYKEAIDAFGKSMEKGDIELEAKALYNIGNSLFQQGQLKDALDYYKQSLERNPDDKDTKYNIEYTEKKIKEMLSKSEQTRQQALKDQAQRKKEEQEGQEKKTQRDKSKENENKSAEEASGKDMDKESKNGSEAKQGQVDKDGAEKKEELDKEDAERFLSAFEQDKKNLTPPVQQESGQGSGTYVEKDW